MFSSLIGRVRPATSPDKTVRSAESLAGFVWRASGVHQFYAGLMAVMVALLQFVPIDLQKRIVDGAIETGDVALLLQLGAIYVAVILLQSGIKYALELYQGWVGESAVKRARDQLAAVAASRPPDDASSTGKTVNVIGREIDAVGNFVGTSISEFVINLTLFVAVSGYMLYIEPTIALVNAVFLGPQVFLALFMQKRLNDLIERQVSLVRKLGSDAVDQKDTSERRTIKAIFDNRMRFNALKFGLKAQLNIANAMGPLMVLLVGGYLVIVGETTIGTVVAFVSGYERLSGPLRDLLNFYREFAQAGVQHQMIVDWAEDEEQGPGSLS